ncbi:hypothetical protein ACFXOM_10755 [Streptomyces sp. NPDC059169]|uniref:hypothetical protein n=1 Tax=Streptomyces sp. NPDC059169 TaxID=3346754 RepID=UPI0036B6D4BA
MLATRKPGRAATCAVAVAVTRVVYGALKARTKGSARWERSNYAGRTVDLCAGPAVTAGAAAGALVAGAPAAAFAVLVAGACGAYDDVAGDDRRGFGAHLGALRSGEVTSGAVKLIGIGAAGLLAGAVMEERPLDKVLAGVVIAGAAHAVNLVDVGPGRASLGVLGLGLPGLLQGPLAAAPVGAAVVVTPDDLGESTMLGDAGAHALGAALGAAVVAGNGRAGLLAHAAALTVAAVCGDRVTELARSPM